MDSDAESFTQPISYISVWFRFILQDQSQFFDGVDNRFQTDGNVIGADAFIPGKTVGDQVDCVSGGSLETGQSL
jgi:hypothetical protein